MANCLIVDDSYDVRSVIERLLKADRHHTILAFNGKEGVESALNNDIDLALIDIGLPDIDGLEVIDRILCKKPRLKIIAISGTHIDHLLEARERGAIATLEKPFHITDLRNLTRRVLANMEVAIAVLDISVFPPECIVCDDLKIAVDVLIKAKSDERDRKDFALVMHKKTDDSQASSIYLCEDYSNEFFLRLH